MQTIISRINILGPSRIQLFSVGTMDCIRRAYKVLMSQNRTAYSLTSSPQDYTYHSPKNRGFSRLPRSKGLNRAIMVSGTRGGRCVRAPKLRNFTLSINKTERIVALRRAFFLSFFESSLASRGHLSPVTHPIILESFPFTKTNSFVTFLRERMQLSRELNRVAVKRNPASRGNMRNRRNVIKRGLLFLSSTDNSRVSSNILGTDTVSYNNVNIRHLAPGGNPGRQILSEVSTFCNFLDFIGVQHEIVNEENEA